MEPRISSVTIFVDDLSRSFEFYRRLFEIPHEQMVIHEDHVAFFFENDLSLVLLENVGAKASQMMLTHAAEFADDVDAILQRVVAAGGKLYNGQRRMLLVTQPFLKTRWPLMGSDCVDVMDEVNDALFIVPFDLDKGIVRRKQDFVVF